MGHPNRRKLALRKHVFPILQSESDAEIRKALEEAKRSFERAFSLAVRHAGGIERLHRQHVSTQPSLSKHEAKNRKPHVIRDYTAEGRGKAYTFKAKQVVHRQSKLKAIASNDGIALRGLSNENGNRLRIADYGFSWSVKGKCWVGNRQQIAYDELFTRFPRLRGLL